MGRKSSAKHGPQSPAAGQSSSSSSSSGRSRAFIIAAIVVVMAGVGLLTVWNGRAADAASDSATAPVEAVGQVSDQNQKAADATAKFGPRQQKNLPPIPFQGYAPPRPPEVVKAAYQFAAEHPEILSYVPCFCGCERSGHKGNHDCFVKSRATNGDVLEWDEHGVECAVCIDVATRSRQLHASGASVKDIRAAIEKQYAGSTVKTPTGHPPGHTDH